MSHIYENCEDTNYDENGEVTEDMYGDSCFVYADGNEEWCEFTDYNHEFFNAQDDCCACGGG